MGPQELQAEHFLELCGLRSQDRGEFKGVKRLR